MRSTANDGCALNPIPYGCLTCPRPDGCVYDLPSGQQAAVLNAARNAAIVAQSTTYSAAELGKRHGLSTREVHRILQLAREAALVSARDAAILDGYERGESAARIAQDSGTSRVTVYKVLKEARG